MPELGTAKQDIMNLPQQYPYNSRWRNFLIGLLLFGGGSYWFYYMTSHLNESAGPFSVIPLVLGPSGAALFYWILAAMSAVFTLMILFTTARQFFIHQILELGKDAIVLPRGVFKTRNIRIPYQEIDRVWETEISGHKSLFLTVGGRQWKIASSLLPDMASYIAIRDYLSSYAHRKDENKYNASYEV